jgi:hypothetical protein
LSLDVSDSELRKIYIFGICFLADL